MNCPKNVKLGLIQLACNEDINSNLDETILSVRKASRLGAQIVCLQELFRSLYFCQTEDPKNFALAETIPGNTTEILSKLAAELKIVLVAPLFEKRADGIYHNSAIVIDADGSITGHYRKMHIPDDPYFYEKFYFTPGDTGFKTFNTRYGRIGILICWDQWFPEAARLTALSGAQFLVYPTAIGFQESDSELAKKQHTAWETIQRSHAIANGVFVACANRVGLDNAIRFWGQSFVCDPFGEIISKGSCDNSEIVLAECNLNLIEETRQNWPFLRDRRVDAYQNLNRLYIDDF